MFDYEKLLVDIGQIFEKKIRQEIDGLKIELNQRFEKIDQKFERIDQKFERIDQKFGEIDQKFYEVDCQFTLLKKEMQDGFDMLKTAVETSNYYYHDLKPRVVTLEEGHDLLVGRVSLLEG